MDWPLRNGKSITQQKTPSPKKNTELIHILRDIRLRQHTTDAHLEDSYANDKFQPDGSLVFSL